VTETLENMAAGRGEVDQQQLAEQLLAHGSRQGVDLLGPKGLSNQLTKKVLKTGLEEEMVEHLGYDKHGPVGRKRGKSRNGVRAKPVLTKIGPWRSRSPRDTDASFQPQMVKKRQRRLTGGHEIVLSLTARGLSAGEISGPLDKVSGVWISKYTISKITDKLVEEMTVGQPTSRPGPFR
jgi:putative transposase